MMYVTMQSIAPFGPVSAIHSCLISLQLHRDEQKLLYLTQNVARAAVLEESMVQCPLGQQEPPASHSCHDVWLGTNP